MQLNEKVRILRKLQTDLEKTLNQDIHFYSNNNQYPNTPTPFLVLNRRPIFFDLQNKLKFDIVHPVQAKRLVQSYNKF